MAAGMSAIMLIEIRVASAQAQAALARVTAQEKALATQTVATNRAASTMGRGLPGLAKWGNQVQWAGRQLQYNFTLPILLAAGAATKFQLDNEKAMTRVVKVYGDAQHQAKDYKGEIDALGRSFEALSNKFGVNQAAVINVAADWAAAGASGLALAKSVDLTLQTMVLGEMDAADATKALISIQAQYGQGVDDLAKTIDTLNMIENQTGISMQGLIEGFARSAGVARSTGVDVRHLGALLAALVPSSGSAANAGNALKTVFSRLLAPTKDASEVLGLMGIKMNDVNWKSLTAVQRIELLAKKYVALGKGVKSHTKELDHNGKATGRMISSQQAVVSSVVASRWQINRWDVLMRDVASSQGYYQKALKSTASAVDNFKQKQYELNTVLNSNPQRLKQTWVIMQNAMANVIQPLIPYITYLAQQVGKLFTKLASLNPAWQKAALFGLLFLAAIGPIGRYVGSVTTLVSMLGRSLKFFSNWAFIAARMTVVFTGSLIKLIALPFLTFFGLLGKGILFVGLGFLKLPMYAVRGMVATYAVTVASFGKLKALFISFRTVMLAIWATTLFPLASMAEATWFIIKGIWTLARIQIFTITMLFEVGQITLFGRMKLALITIWGATSSAMRAIWALNLKVIWGMTVGMATKLPALFARLGGLLVAAFSGPWGWVAIAIAAAIVLIIKYRDQLFQALQNVVKAMGAVAGAIGKSLQPIVDGFRNAAQNAVDAFWALPKGVSGAMVAVVKVVAAAVMAVYNWFSYMNPWAHHSPSLVENVTTGMDAIVKQFGRAQNIGNIFSKARRDLQAFGVVAARMKVHDASKNAAGGGGLAQSMLADYKKLLPVMNRQEKAVARQQVVVDAWSAALDRSNAKLDAQQHRLDALQAHLSSLQAQYDAHKNAMQAWADSPIKGMRAMSNEIFNNGQQQKRLQLQMLKWQQANGSIESVTNKLQEMQGTIELLSGDKNALRMAGAGTDVTGPIQAQINTLNKQSDKMKGLINNSPMAAWQKQLDKLDLKGQILDLQNSLKFDGPIRQIDQLVNGMKEIPLAQIIAGIKKEKGAMAGLQPSINAAVKSVNAQQNAVDAYTASRDRLQRRYDAESKSLSHLNDQYSKTKDLVDGLESALNSLAQARDARRAAKKAKKPKSTAKPKLPKVKKLGTGAQNFVDAAGGGFPDPGGNARIGREGGWKPQTFDINKFTQGVTDDITKSFTKIDMFGPIKKKWNEVWGWIKTNIPPIMKPIGDGIHTFMQDIASKTHRFKIGFQIGNTRDPALRNIGKQFGQMYKIGARVRRIWDKVTGAFSKAAGTAAFLWGWVKKIANLFGPDVTRTVTAFKGAWSDLGTKVLPQLKQFAPLAKELWFAFRNVASIVGPILLAALKILVTMFTTALGPALHFVILIIADIIQVIRGLLEFVLGVLAGDWKMAWKGIVDVLAGTFKAVWNLLKGLFETASYLVFGFFKGIIEIAKWCWNELVGHSIIPDIVKGVTKWFHKLGALGTWLWNHSFGPIVKLAKKLFNLVMKIFGLYWSGVKLELKGIKLLGQWLWDHALKPAWHMVQNLWKLVKKIFGYVWTGVKIELKGFKTIGTWIWNNALKPAWHKVQDLWKFMKKLFGGIWAGVKLELAGLKLLASWFNTHVIAPFKRALTNFFGKGGTLRTAFSNAVDAVGRVWSGIEKLVKDPVRIIVNTVYNNGIRWALNKIPGVNLGAAHVKWAKGGVLPGYTPGRDPHKFYSPTGGRLELSGGEAIMRPEWTRAVGGPKEVARQNKMARTGKLTGKENSIGAFADGGVVQKFMLGGTVGGGGFANGRTIMDGESISAIAARQIRLMEKISHRNITVIQGGYGGHHYGPSGTSHNYPGVADLSPGTIGMEKLARQVGFAAWARNIRGRVQVGSGAHIHAVSLLDPGDAKSPQVYGSWPAHKDGYRGGPGSDPAPHYSWLANLKKLLGNIPLANLGGGSGNGGGGGYTGPSVKDVKAGIHIKEWIAMLKKTGAVGKKLPTVIKDVAGTGLSWAKDKITGLIKKAGSIYSNLGAGSVKDQVRSLAIQRKWGSGAQWSALDKLIFSESSWNPKAENNTSTASGLFQFIDSTARLYGLPGHASRFPVKQQAVAGLNYIRDKYIDPSGAWHHHQIYGTYEKGGVLPVDMARGGIAKATRGGVFTRVAEKGQDEAIIPLPRNWRSDVQGKNGNSKTTNITITGNLEFPNISDGNDAEKFIENLKILAKD